jgi:hypothetical protein
MDTSDLISNQLINCLSKGKIDFEENQDLDSDNEGLNKDIINPEIQEEKIKNILQNLQKTVKNEDSLLELLELEETCKDLAVYLVYSTGTLTLL